MIDNYNVLIGTLSNERTNWFKNKYDFGVMSTLMCTNQEINVVMRKELHNKFAGKRVICTGFLDSQNRKEYKSYFYCVRVEAVEEDADDEKRIDMEGTVVALSELILSSEYVTKIKLVLMCDVNCFGRRRVIRVPCRCYDYTAKSMIDLDVGDRLFVSGYVSQANKKAHMTIQRYERR